MKLQLFLARFACAALATLAPHVHGGEESMPFIEVAPGTRTFRLAGPDRVFSPWGFNYDRDDRSRLIEDYWHDEWDAVAGDFREMRTLGANVVRVHLQFARFMRSAVEPDESNVRQLAKLLTLAEKTGLYVDLTGLGCYRKSDVPPWYDALAESERWAAQARFWEVVAAACAQSPAVFCYDLMNEPVVPVGRGSAADWLGKPFGGPEGFCYVQRISIDQAERPREEIALRWIETLAAAIRKHDTRHLITVGLVDWSLALPAHLYSGFAPTKIAAPLDFLSVHLYPRDDKLDEDLATLAAFAVAGKPVVIEETFPLGSTMENFARFIAASRKDAAGHFGFYWGKPPAELAADKSPTDMLLLAWLEYFQKEARRRLESP
jgi:hypothetical protein